MALVYERGDAQAAAMTVLIACPHTDPIGKWFASLGQGIGAHMASTAAKMDGDIPDSSVWCGDAQLPSAGLHDSPDDTLVFLGHGNPDGPCDNSGGRLCDSTCTLGHWVVISFGCETAQVYGPALAAQIPGSAFLGFAERFIAVLASRPDRLAELIADAIYLHSTVEELEVDLRRYLKRVEDANWRSASGSRGSREAPVLAMAAGYNRQSLRTYGPVGRPIVHV